MTIGYNEIEDVKIDELWWQKRGLMCTRSGYGNKIPTCYKVKVQNRWYRVYARTISNISTCYIVRGKVEKGHIYELNNVVDTDDVRQKWTEKAI